MTLDTKITLKRLNVVKVVDSEDKAQALVAKGFKRVTADDAKPSKTKKQQGKDKSNPDGGQTPPDNSNPEGGK